MKKRKKPPTSADLANAYLSRIAHVFRRGHHYAFNGCYYQQIEDQIMLRAISQFISSEENPSAANALKVRNVVETIAQKSGQKSLPSEPIRIDGTPSGNVIAFENGLLQLDQLIIGKCHEPALLTVTQP